MPTSAWEPEQRNWFETKPIYFKKHNVLKLCWQHLHVLQAALISEGQHTWVAPCDHFLPPTNASPRMLSASTGSWVSWVNNRLHCHPTHPKNSNPVRYAWCIHIQWILWILEQDGTFLQSKQVSSYMLHMVDNLRIINIEFYSHRKLQYIQDIDSSRKHTFTRPQWRAMDFTYDAYVIMVESTTGTATNYYQTLRWMSMSLCSLQSRLWFLSFWLKHSPWSSSSRNIAQTSCDLKCTWHRI